jgi:hypothetical protein
VLAGRPLVGHDELPDETVQRRAQVVDGVADDDAQPKRRLLLDLQTLDMPSRHRIELTSRAIRVLLVEETLPLRFQGLQVVASPLDLFPASG